MKKALKVVLCVLGAVVALAALGILFLTITEYRPADVEQLEVISEEHDGGAADPVSPQLQAGDALRRGYLIPRRREKAAVDSADRRPRYRDVGAGVVQRVNAGAAETAARRKPPPTELPLRSTSTASPTRWTSCYLI